MAILAVTVFVGGGATWLVPIVLLFGTSVLLGRAGSTAANHSSRTLGQVAANGGVAWLAIVLMLLAEGAQAWSVDDAGFVYIGALAVATSNTWATEFGTRFGRGAQDIMTGQSVNAGTSAALAGAIMIALTLPVVLPRYAGDWKSIGAIAFIGFAGMVIDSFIGSGAQRRYRCKKCGTLTEEPRHCDRRTSIRSGLFTNDQVNWLATAAGGIGAWWWAA